MSEKTWAVHHTATTPLPQQPNAASSPAPESGPEAARSGAEAMPSASPGAPPSPTTAPALNPPRWSGRKTAIAAALAIGISSMGAIGAAAALPKGTAQDSTGQFQGPGQRPGQGGFQPRGGTGQLGQGVRPGTVTP